LNTILKALSQRAEKPQEKFGTMPFNHFISRIPPLLGERIVPDPRFDFPS
jgi:hypothetical protein